MHTHVRTHASTPLSPPHLHVVNQRVIQVHLVTGTVRGNLLLDHLRELLGGNHLVQHQPHQALSVLKGRASRSCKEPEGGGGVGRNQKEAEELGGDRRHYQQEYPSTLTSVTCSSDTPVRFSV